MQHDEDITANLKTSYLFCNLSLYKPPLFLMYSFNIIARFKLLYPFGLLGFK